MKRIIAVILSLFFVASVQAGIVWIDTGAASDTTDTNSVVMLNFRPDGTIYWTPANQLWPWRYLTNWYEPTTPGIGYAYKMQVDLCKHDLAGIGEGGSGLMTCNLCNYKTSQGSVVSVIGPQMPLAGDIFGYVTLNGDSSGTGTLGLSFYRQDTGAMVAVGDLAVTINNDMPSPAPNSPYFVRPISDHVVHTYVSSNPSFSFGASAEGWWFGGMNTTTWVPMVQSGAWGHNNSPNGSAQECFFYPCDNTNAWGQNVRMKVELVDGDLSYFDVSGDPILPAFDPGNSGTPVWGRATAISLKQSAENGIYTLKLRATLTAIDQDFFPLDPGDITIIFHKNQ